MDKTKIPEDLESIVFSVAKYYHKKNYRIRQLHAIAEDAPYRTTLVASKGTLNILIEAQKASRFHGALESLTRWLAAQRKHCEFYIATGDAGELTGGFLKELKAEGVGLLVVDDRGHIHIQFKARNNALVIRPDPTLNFGSLSDAVSDSLIKFNDVDRKDGLRDMCEIVEGLTEDVLVAAARKGIMAMDEAAARSQDWSCQINSLASSKACNGAPIIDDSLKGDLHAFRDGRNLVDHPVAGLRENAKRERRYADKMTMGPRLVAELQSIKRRISRIRTASAKIIP